MFFNKILNKILTCYFLLSFHSLKSFEESIEKIHKHKNLFAKMVKKEIYMDRKIQKIALKLQQNNITEFMHNEKFGKLKKYIL